MLEFFRKLFATDFMPHVYCLRQPGLIGVHAVSDALIAISYFVIPVSIVLLVRRRRDLAFSWMFLLFGTFILSCGLTHALAIWTLWNPVYRFEGLVKFITAVASVPTAILLIRLVPQAVALPSSELLRAEIAEKERAEQEVRRLNRELEDRVAERTAALTESNRKLAESEARLQNILDSAHALIYVKDLGGRLQFVNRRFEETLAIAREQAVGKTDRELFPLELALTYEKNDRAVYELGPQESEELAQQPDGVHTYLSSKFPLRDLEGNVYAICGISTDITDRKRVEDQLKRTETALRNSNSELRQFAYAAAHDLQEPLRNIAVSAGLLRRLGKDCLDEEAKTLVEISIEGAQRMHTMVKDLLTYTQVIETLEPLAGGANAGEVLQEILTELTEPILAAHATIQFESLPILPVESSHLSHLFHNVIDNALKYRRADVAPLIRVSADRKGDRWTFTVADNGIGFDNAYAERIFGVFKRLHQRREYPGNGIGLAICARIVAYYGGRIWAEGKPGVGAIFRFTLPARDESVDSLHERVA